jgi:hypothetical protein
MQANRSHSDEKYGTSNGIARSVEHLLTDTLCGVAWYHNRLLRTVNALNPTNRLQIVDARSKTAATANYARGAGMEGARYTDFGDIHFMNIDNIHTMRECQQKLFDLLKSNTAEVWHGVHSAIRSFAKPTQYDTMLCYAL